MIPSRKNILDKICDVAGIHPAKVKGCYMFGSRVYGTSSNASDYDFILIANNSTYEVEVNDGVYNIHIIAPQQFDKWVIENHIKAVECLFAPEWAVLVPYTMMPFEYKEKSFRHWVSHTASNSWVKCKKKLAQGDYYIGIKSLFHSLRILDFGIQFAMHRSIDFKSANRYWEMINSKTITDKWDWEMIQRKFQPIRNELKSQFKEVTPNASK